MVDWNDLSIAKGYATAATDEDSKGNFDAAVTFYDEACRFLLRYVKKETDATAQTNIRETIKRYLDRIEQLSTLLEAQRVSNLDEENQEDNIGNSEEVSEPLSSRSSSSKDLLEDAKVFSTTSSSSQPPGGSSGNRSVTIRARLLDRALAEFSRGSRLESERKFRVACNAYISAIDLLQKCLLHETDPSAVAVINDRITATTQRIKQIEAVIKLQVLANSDPPLTFDSPVTLSTVGAPMGIRSASIPSSGRVELVKSPTNVTLGRIYKAAITQHNSVSQAELVMLQNSVINGVRFPLWDDPKVGFLSANLENNGTVFKDNPLQLSQKQIKRDAEYHRPVDYLSNILQQGETPRIVVAPSPYTISQSVVGDCSFVCSLAVCANYEQRFSAKVITRAIYPQSADGIPIYNPSGKYAVKMLLNGAVRMIIVGDSLPVNVKSSSTPSLLCAHSTNFLELWISLYEKAYMKVNGGKYDFPGSNSGADLYSLCGWIPDLIHFTSEQNNISIWDKLFQAHHNGQVLLTICTASEGEMEKSWEEKLGLVPGHAYAILEMKEILGYRMCLVKNPWTYQRWLGRFSHQDQRNWTPELKQALHWDKIASYHTDNGIFWIDWNDVCAYFNRCNLSWNPYAFTHRIMLHESWVKKVSEGNSYVRNPQFHLYCETSNPTTKVWILLSVHIHNSREEYLFVTLHIVDNSKLAKGTGRSLAGCQMNKPVDSCRFRRVYTAPQSVFVHSGIYRNTPQYLAPLELPTGIHDYTVIVSSVESKPMDFSVTVYSTLPSLSFHSLPKTTYPERVAILGEWKPNSLPSKFKFTCDSLLLLDMPQYHLHITKALDILVRAESANKDAIVEILLIRWTEETVGSQDSCWKGRIDYPREVIAQTMGKSFAHFCVSQQSQRQRNTTAVEGNDESSASTPLNEALLLQPGDYTLVVRRCGNDNEKADNYVLRIESLGEGDSANWGEYTTTPQCKIPRALIPPEGEGMPTTLIVPGAWTHQLCGGSSELPRNPIFTLIPSVGSTVVTLRLRLQEPCSCSSSDVPAIGLHVFLDSTCQTTLVRKCKYHSMACGVVISGLQMGGEGIPMYVVASTHQAGYVGPFALVVMARSHVSIRQVN